MKLLTFVRYGLCSQLIAAYVIVNRERVYETNEAALGGQNYDEAYTDRLSLPNMRISAYGKQLLQLYYLVQVMRSYHRPAYQEPTAILSNLIDRLTKAELRGELEKLLSGVDGFEEVFNIGEYAERDPIKEQLANDFRLLFPIVVKTLSGLYTDEVNGIGMEGTLQSKLHGAFNDFRGLLSSVVQSESEVFHEIEEPQGLDGGVGLRPEDVPSVAGTVYGTMMPVASDKIIVNDYDLEEDQTSTASSGAKEEDESAELLDVRLQDGNELDFLPDGNDVKYELALGPDMLSHDHESDEDEDDETELIILTEDANLEKTPTQSGEGSLGPTAVLVKDPEMAALIPHIIEQLRMENVTPEEEETLAEIFDELWPLMMAEAGRESAKP